MKVFFIGSVVAQVCALVRYVVLARILGPEQLGLAAILILTSLFFDLLTEGGISIYLIQSEDGDDPRVQSMVQLVNLVRCAVMAGTLLLIAKPLAMFYDRPELAVGIRWLCLSPLILAFLHYDVKRFQRAHNFGPEGWMMIASESLALVGAAVIAILTHSYYAVAFGLAGRSLAMVGVSHFFAERPFRLGFVAASWKALRAYSWPLMIDGLLLFIGQQGDRLLIGKRLGVEALGYYAALLLLIYYPTGLITRLVQSVNLPQVVDARRDESLLNQRVDVLGGHFLLLGLAMLLGFCATMPVMVPLLYGHRFAVAAYTVALVGVLQTARFLRGWPTTFALGMGRSRQVMANNLLRLLAFPLAIGGQVVIGGLPGILIGFVIGEVLAFVTATYLVDRTSDRAALADMIDIGLFTVAGLALCTAGYRLGQGEWTIPLGLWAVALAATAGVAYRRRTAVAQAGPLLQRIFRGRARSRAQA
ncbi:polysaccharide biosynthesis protein [Novosphingobium nitrogenifigens DSM 19370]|uniref:Polysaccharide biosynthesis protein n=1 Tax=Novosphingobium nitrogenifigens DSM 19370 TaxID=983920 RepID=F1Z4Z3_9SPHN|nr:oligosaccharide flippase family protein [Novosphingobium nitrogenifigens]EGD59984.1 polysaccharide biosynthesis protein [Novosphingobium nitrogenifigens DSM 19370]